MSWDGYLDNIIAHSKDANGDAHIDKVCLIGLDGGAFWNTNNHPAAFKLSASEAQVIANTMKRNPGDLAGNGIHCEGVKYMFLRGDGQKLALGKKKDHGAVTVQASKTAIIIAHCPEGKQHGNCNKAVSNVAEYLEQQGM